MRILDISRELQTCPLAPECPSPRLERISDIGTGAVYHYTCLHASLHTATHCDAPLHFVRDGADITGVDLARFVGPCLVMTARQDRLFLPEDLEKVPAGVRRLLLRGEGNSYLSREAADTLADRGVFTVGTDAFSIGAPSNDTEVHTALLSRGVAVIENLDLGRAEDGFYFLSAAPCKFGGAEAAFCRAVLLAGIPIEEEAYETEGK